ncbi:M48 family metallopeptidase [Kitasatospora sp. NPDC085895]|uniref:M48 metallopeptidase family protein n=1 Tax=Kitasatospora sp. NPDC085895 TaxID=3155057 RepID=UPI00345012F0
MAAEPDTRSPSPRRRTRAASGSGAAAAGAHGRTRQAEPPEQQGTAPGPSAEPAAEPSTALSGAPPAVDRSTVEVRRSTRRSRTVSAYREGDRTVVLIPARMSKAEEQRWVSQMVERLARQESRRTLGDDALEARARDLSAEYLGGRAVPRRVRWVTNQNSRWGSCTPAEGSIRLSHRLQGMPGYVVDYVLLHELAHLLVADHGPRFWALLEAYPRTERARGYLEGVAAAGRLPHLPGARGGTAGDAAAGGPTAEERTADGTADPDGCD